MIMFPREGWRYSFRTPPPPQNFIEALHRKLPQYPKGNCHYLLPREGVKCWSFQVTSGESWPDPPSWPCDNLMTPSTPKHLLVVNWHSIFYIPQLYSVYSNWSSLCSLKKHVILSSKSFIPPSPPPRDKYSLSLSRCAWTQVKHRVIKFSYILMSMIEKWINPYQNSKAQWRILSGLLVHCTSQYKSWKPFICKSLVELYSKVKDYFLRSRFLVEASHLHKTFQLMD